MKTYGFEITKDKDGNYIIAQNDPYSEGGEASIILSIYELVALGQYIKESIDGTKET